MSLVSGSDMLVLDESRLNSGTAIEGAAGVAWGVFWSSSPSSLALTSGLSLTGSFSSLATALSPLLAWLFSLSPSCSRVALICFESGGGRRDHDRRHVFGGCRCIKNVKDRISNEMPQTAMLVLISSLEL